MKFIRGRYSWLLRPALVVFDVLVLNILAHYFLNFKIEKTISFSSNLFNDKYLLYFFYSSVMWFVSTFFTNFYEVYRYTSFIKILSLLFKQSVVYGLSTFAFIGIFRNINVQSDSAIFTYLLYSFLIIGCVKLLSFFVLKGFRSLFKGNLRNIMVLGFGDNIKELTEMFIKRRELGYNVKGIFSNRTGDSIKGTISDGLSFLRKNNDIDEIYCAIDELTDVEINECIKQANIMHCNIKFVPSTFKLATKQFNIDFYEYLPVLSIQESVLSNDLNKFVKRSFDILFSLFIIIVVLSWLSLVLFFLIKLESKGPLFYRHKRNGINYKEFDCYKFRSLKITEEIKGTYVKQDDTRVTKIGKFLRKTSIDELPQFINVLKGDMSVVGPRPHMPSYTDEYSKKIDKHNFVFRHQVKPGITGLAQVKGYRGEVEIDKDIINRVKYDVFYIENWSLLLDIKIIIQTFINVLKGEEKAY